MSTPEKCPKCGAGNKRWDFRTGSGYNYACGTLFEESTKKCVESRFCLTAQRDQLASQVAELAECLTLLHSILKEWQADFPDCVGDKEPAAMAKAASLIAKHKTTP